MSNHQKSWHFIGVKKVIFDANKGMPIFILDTGKVMVPDLQWQGDTAFLYWKEDKDTMLNEVEDYVASLNVQGQGEEHV